ncbi:matrixin family metalloprotease [Halothiobacillus diazotrophicus]|nr:matrixin family metalloprotease [Halothiobacillus diazotrophicus]
MQVEKDGIKVQIHYLIEGTDEEESPLGICKSELWKISSTATPKLDIFPSLLTSLGLSNLVHVNTADLTGSAVGSTSGATITLDTDAAGYGWYIDYTPYLNEEYLPTSNPYEWVAKPGSAAAGKMDMLSVLLHEYGHALGLEHSADPNDFMGATLQPGVRRLPSAQELALLTQLSEAAGGAANSVVDLTAHSPLQVPAPDEPGNPLRVRAVAGGGLYPAVALNR